MYKPKPKCHGCCIMPKHISLSDVECSSRSGFRFAIGFRLVVVLVMGFDPRCSPAQPGLARPGLAWLGPAACRDYMLPCACGWSASYFANVYGKAPAPMAIDADTLRAIAATEICLSMGVSSRGVGGRHFYIRKPARCTGRHCGRAGRHSTGSC